MLLHRDALAPKRVYTKLAFTQMSVYTQQLLETEAVYADELLHTVVFTHRSFYTEER